MDKFGNAFRGLNYQARYHSSLSISLDSKIASYIYMVILMGNHEVCAFFAGHSRAQDDSNMHLYGECTHETIHEDCLSHVVDQCALFHRYAALRIFEDRFLLFTPIERVVGQFFEDRFPYSRIDMLIYVYLDLQLRFRFPSA